MMLLIPTPDYKIYPLTTFIMAALTSFTSSGYVYARWLVKTKINLMTINTLIKTSIVISGTLIISINFLFINTLAHSLVFILFGIICGIFSVKSEQSINRYFLYHYPKTNISFLSSTVSSDRTVNGIRKNTQLQLSSHSIPQNLRIVNQANLSIDFSNPSLITLVLLAILEEIIFRGFLLTLSWQLPSALLSITALLFINIIFALSHLPLGLPQCLAKFSLAIITTAITLLTASLLPAITTHVFLNIFAWFSDHYRAIKK